MRLTNAEDGIVSGTVHRLLILHLGMTQNDFGDKCNGPSENDSDEEFNEKMILYHRNLVATETDDSDEHSMRKVVQFAGLCLTLYTLSELTAMEEFEAAEDRTQVVDLSEYSLVFLSLEEPGNNIIAAALVSRRSAAYHVGTPEAIRFALRRCHELFCLLRGGGICHRLGSLKSLETLHQLHKRELLEQRNILDNGGKEDRLALIQKEISDLSSTSPLTLLREDLRVHYGVFLDEFNLTLTDYAACRCIVECPLSEARTTFEECEKLPFGNSAVLSLNQNLRNFLRQPDNLRVFGVSLFLNGVLLFTEERGSHCISNHIAYLLLNYMFNIRSKMQQLSGSDFGSPGSFSLGFRSDLSERANSRRLVSMVESQFMGPPPLSLLSASEDAVDIQGSSPDTRVWAPFMHLRQQDGTVEKCRVCLFGANSASFLLFMSCDRLAAAETDDTLYSAHLCSFQDFVSTNDIAEKLDTNTDPFPFLVPGQDVIFIDRSNSSVTALMKEEQEKVSTIPPKSRLRLFAPKVARGSTVHAISMNVVDFRRKYHFASKLSVDSLLAFEDAMTELQRRGGNSNDSVEICSLLPKCWMFAQCKGCEEIYVFFDLKLYVTVNDVHHAASRIWSDFPRMGKYAKQIPTRTSDSQPNVLVVSMLWV